MTRAEMRTELQASGFGTATADVTRENLWLDQAVIAIWNARDPSGLAINWSFSHVDQATLAVSGATPTMPAGFGSVDYIVDDLGNELTELAPEDFDAYYASAAALGLTAARADSFKVVNRQVTLGPTPSMTASYKWSYRLRASTLTNAAVTQAGGFQADTDTPFWPNHHMILVHHAALLGHASNSNPNAGLFQQLRDDALQAMRADLEIEFAPGRQWGAYR